MTSSASPRRLPRVGSSGRSYEVVSVWRVAGTVDEVTAVLGDAESLVRWWPSVYLDVVVRERGGQGGVGRWTFEQVGPDVVLVYDWQVTVGKPLLARLGWLLKPVFEANHRWAMARGEQSLRLELRRRRAGTESERARVPPPPPATFR